MTRTTKPSMKNALQGSLKSEQSSFAARLAKADEKFADEPSINEAAPITESVSVPPTKVVREAFTIPEQEHKQIDFLRNKLLSNAIAATKSEIVRAGLLLLTEADDQTLIDVMQRLERVKTGRPKAS